MGWIVWVVIGVVILLLLLWGVAIYNRLVRQRALVREGFSGINVQLRRRADLIPNLVSTVEGYATHEREDSKRDPATKTHINLPRWTSLSRASARPPLEP